MRKLLATLLRERRALHFPFHFLHSLCEVESEHAGGSNSPSGGPHSTRGIPTNEPPDPHVVASVFAPVLCRPPETAYLSIRRQGLQRTRMFVHVLIDRFSDLEDAFSSEALVRPLSTHASAGGPLDSPKASARTRPDILRTPPPKSNESMRLFRSPLVSSPSPTSYAGAEYHRRFFGLVKDSAYQLFDNASSSGTARTWVNTIVTDCCGWRPGDRS